MEHEKMLAYFLIGMIATFGITVAILKKLIPYLKGKKIGQKILDIGPRWQKNKEGTPTMGGLAFIIASVIVISFLIGFAVLKKDVSDASVLIICFAYALINGLIGIVDDYAKLFKKQNQGLSAGAKYFLQLVATAIFLLVLGVFNKFSTVLYIPYFNIEFDFGWTYYVICAILMTGIVNSVNLTDGIDGLASGVTFVVASFFAVVSFVLASCEGVIFSSVIIGAAVGFLFYNFYPARVFMGDTGSLFFGGAVVGLGFVLGNPLITVIVGIIYILEAVSDIIQVGCFKITKKIYGQGKRVFKMAPFHHHLELCGWSENRIVITFSLVTALFGVIAYFGMGI